MMESFLHALQIVLTLFVVFGLIAFFGWLCPVPPVENPFTRRYPKPLSPAERAERALARIKEARAAAHRQEVADREQFAQLEAVYGSDRDFVPMMRSLGYWQRELGHGRQWMSRNGNPCSSVETWRLP